jgi:hypothetical protein
MRPPRKKSTAAKLRSWRVSILRQRAHNLGTIEASDANAAETEAVKAFGLTKKRRKRLLISEADYRKEDPGHRRVAGVPHRGCRTGCADAAKVAELGFEMVKASRRRTTNADGLSCSSPPSSGRLSPSW